MKIPHPNQLETHFIQCVFGDFVIAIECVMNNFPMEYMFEMVMKRFSGFE